ncbi:MAG: Hsp70 family protein, partial [Promethearchaeota archaeon]
EAEKNKERDEEIKRIIQKRNELDGMAFSAEKLMKENPDKLDDALKNNLLKAIENAKDVVKNKPDNEKAIDEAKSELEKYMHQFAEKLYKQQGAAGGAAGGPTGPGGMDDFIRQAQRAANMGAKSSQADSGEKESKDKKRVVDVEWEDES